MLPSNVHVIHDDPQVVEIFSETFFANVVSERKSDVHISQMMTNKWRPLSEASAKSNEVFDNLPGGRSPQIEFEPSSWLQKKYVNPRQPEGFNLKTYLPDSR